MRGRVASSTPARPSRVPRGDHMDSSNQVAPAAAYGATAAATAGTGMAATTIAAAHGLPATARLYLRGLASVHIAEA